MEQFVRKMINEHRELVARIDALHNYVYSSASDKDDKFEFANKCIQLAAMKKYAEALGARLFNQGIKIVDGEYMVSVDEDQCTCEHQFGSDYDIDKQKIAEKQARNVDHCKGDDIKYE